MTTATTFVTTDGVNLAARSWPAAGAARATVVVVHGFAATKDDPSVSDLATRLTSEGLHVVSYDARGHGASGGACTLGDLERLDVASAVEWAHSLGRPVVLVGASMGGIAALRHAAGASDLAGVVVVSTPAEWRIPPRSRALLTVGLTRTRPGRWVSDRRMRVRLHPVWSAPEPPRVLISRVTAPLAIVHGDRDRLIPPGAALQLYACSPRPKRLFLVPGMGHAFDPGGHAAIVEAVAWTLAE